MAGKAPRSPAERPGGRPAPKAQRGRKGPAKGKQRPAVEQPTRRAYRGDARHWEVAPWDWEWHTEQGRRFYAGEGYELATLTAVEIAIVHGEEVWSR